MSSLLDFLASNTHLATRNQKFQTEIEPECDKDFFFGLHMNLGAKFQTNRIIKFNQTLQKHFPLKTCLINKK